MCDFLEDCQETQKHFGQQDECTPSNPLEIATANDEESNKENVRSPEFQKSTKRKASSPLEPRKAQKENDLQSEEVDTTPPQPEVPEPPPELDENILAEITQNSDPKTSKNPKHTKKRKVVASNRVVKHGATKKDAKIGQKSSRRNLNKTPNLMANSEVESSEKLLKTASPQLLKESGSEPLKESNFEPSKAPTAPPIVQKAIEIRPSLQKFIRNSESPPAVIAKSTEKAEAAEKVAKVDENNVSSVKGEGTSKKKQGTVSSKEHFNAVEDKGIVQSLKALLEPATPLEVSEDAVLPNSKKTRTTSARLSTNINEVSRQPGDVESGVPKSESTKRKLRQSTKNARSIIEQSSEDEDDPRELQDNFREKSRKRPSYASQRQSSEAKLRESNSKAQNGIVSRNSRRTPPIFNGTSTNLESAEVDVEKSEFKKRGRQRSTKNSATILKSSSEDEQNSQERTKKMKEKRGKRASSTLRRKTSDAESELQKNLTSESSGGISQELLKKSLKSPQQRLSSQQEQFQLLETLQLRPRVAGSRPDASKVPELQQNCTQRRSKSVELRSNSLELPLKRSPSARHRSLTNSFSEDDENSDETSQSNDHKRRKNSAIYGKISQLISEEDKKSIEKLYTIDMSVIDAAKVEENIQCTDRKQLICTICRTSYPRLDKCRVHIWGHLDMKPYKCTACEFSTVTVTNIRCHIRKSHLKIKPFECNFCKKRYVTAVLLGEHLNTHNGIRPYKCKTCGFASASRQVLSYHRTTHKVVKDVTCDICNKEFYSKGRMRAHMVTHNKNRELMCKYCSHHFSTAEALQKHYDNVHSKDYVCDICGKTTKSRKALHNHQNVHSEAKFKCNLCPNVYKSGHILKEHLLKHEGIRKYKCEICGKNFAQQSHLAAHMAVHSERRFLCPGCQRAFNRHDNMKIHTKRCAPFNANPELKDLLNRRMRRGGVAKDAEAVGFKGFKTEEQADDGCEEAVRQQGDAEKAHEPAAVPENGDLSAHEHGINPQDGDQRIRAAEVRAKAPEAFRIGQVVVIPIPAVVPSDANCHAQQPITITENVIKLECF